MAWRPLTPPTVDAHQAGRLVNAISWRKVAVGGGAAVGAAAAYNHLAAKGIAPLANLLGGEEGWFEWRGHRVAYTRHGDGPATPAILLHSPHPSASSYEWRHVAGALGAERPVYALDLLGFGRSARPAVRYSAHLYLALVADFAARVAARPATLVGSSLAGAWAITLAARDPARFPAVVAIAPTGLERPEERAPRMSGLSLAALSLPVIGTSLYNSMVSRPRLRQMLERAYRDDTRVTDDLLSAHYATAHQPGAKHAAAAWLAGRLDLDVREALRRLRQPLLVVWGRHASAAPVDDSLRFRALRPDLELAILDRAADLPHDERADEFNEVASQFLRRHEQRVAEPPVPPAGRRPMTA